MRFGDVTGQKPMPAIRAARIEAQSSFSTYFRCSRI
jgi:hypothetical protein